jgi:hypothetical protein
MQQPLWLPARAAHGQQLQLALRKQTVPIPSSQARMAYLVNVVAVMVLIPLTVSTLAIVLDAPNHARAKTVNILAAQVLLPLLLMDPTHPALVLTMGKHVL